MLRQVRSLLSLRPFVEALVHPSVAGLGVDQVRHQSFIAFHLAVGVVALAIIPPYLLLARAPDPTLLAAVACLAMSAPIAIFVSRTGYILPGHLMVSAALAAAILARAYNTGGLSSPALFAGIIVPLEAALSGRRATVVAAVVILGLMLVLCGALETLGHLPAADGGPFAFKPGMMLLVGYVVGLVVRLHALHTAIMGDAVMAREQLRLLAWNIGDIITLHDRQGDVVYAAPGQNSSAHLSEKAAMGAGLFRRIHVADRPAYLTALADAMPLGASSMVEFRLRRESGPQAGTYLWMEMRCRSLAEELVPNRDARVVAVIRDIGERKAHESELDRARCVAEEASLAKSRFLANVSHELRTPLNAIIGFSELLETEVYGRFTDAKQREYVGLIHESGLHLLKVVNDILDMSKIEAGRFSLAIETFDAADAIRRTERLLAHQAAEAGITVTLALAGDVPQLQADPRAFRQIVINLLSNAIKFSSRGDGVRVGLKCDGRMLALSVSDNGIGIAEKDIERLGTPFVQAHSGYNRRHEGTGLGLSMVKGLANLHGGGMKIESRLGHGTTVTVYLPVVAMPLVEPEGAERVVPLRPEEPATSADVHDFKQRQRRA